MQYSWPMMSNCFSEDSSNLICCCCRMLRSQCVCPSDVYNWLVTELYNYIFLNRHARMRPYQFPIYFINASRNSINLSWTLPFFIIGLSRIARKARIWLDMDSSTLQWNLPWSPVKPNQCSLTYLHLVNVLYPSNLAVLRWTNSAITKDFGRLRRSLSSTIKYVLSSSKKKKFSSIFKSNLFQLEGGVIIIHWFDIDQKELTCPENFGLSMTEISCVECYLQWTRSYQASCPIWKLVR